MKSGFAKVGYASASLVAILGYIASQFGASYLTLLWVLAGVLTFILLASLHAVAGAWLRSYLFRRGAVDAQWLWFNGPVDRTSFQADALPERPQ